MAYPYGHEGQIKLIASGSPAAMSFSAALTGPLETTITVLYQPLTHKAVATMHLMASATSDFYLNPVIATIR